MNIRQSTTEEQRRWNELLVANPDGGNTLQTPEYAQAKQLSGWQPQYLMWEERVAFLALSRKIFGLGQVWYLPKGPGIVDADEFVRFLGDLKTYARSQGAFLVRVEPEVPASDSADAKIRATGAVKTMDVQARSTVIVDLSPDEDALFKGLPQPGRYAVGRARRDEGVVEAVPTTAENIEIAYEMLKNTAVVGGFRIRPRDYYVTFWNNFSNSGLGQMFFIKHHERVIAMAYIILLGDKASYKDGASIKDRPVYGASHLLQWEAMMWAKEHGARTYDLTGTPPKADQKDNTHPLFGLVKFKTSFNKEITDHVGVYDMELDRRKVQIWHKIGYRLARRVHNRKRNEVYW